VATSPSGAFCKCNIAGATTGTFPNLECPT
jgi:hypothetical protein